MFLFDNKGRLIVPPGENTIKAGSNETLEFIQGEESSDPLVRAIVAGYAANPEGMRNLGELHNLSIRRGTLSAEDRFTINEHIVQTILMLKRLPFPEGMKDVPEIAGSHHETMTGSGYPRGLRREDMTVPARIMAVADIFEALTARDRPYKKPKTLGESLRIMSLMRDEGHIDADLFDLFLTSGACLDYARQYLDPAQLDAADLGAFLSTDASGEGRRAG